VRLLTRASVGDQLCCVERQSRVIGCEGVAVMGAMSVSDGPVGGPSGKVQDSADGRMDLDRK
jgi:hypothetical protein